VVDSFELSEEFSIIEANVPEEYIGKSIREIGFRQKFNLLVLTTIKKEEVKSVLGKSQTMERVLGIATPDLVLQENEILVLFGSNQDLETFLKKRF
jgi:trk system potassium uptake protein TrkA